VTACREKLPQSKVPAIVSFVDGLLPRTSDGKVQRYILRLDAAARVADLAV
jgi:acyl-coenzyme A synthetase/AMP-(fatty) acid ligase